MPARRILGLVAALATLAAACGSSTTVDDADVAPFDAVLIELFGTTDTSAYLTAAEQDAAELVVICMNEAGFDYQIPAAPVAPIETSEDLEFASTEGFGIVSNFRQQVQSTDFATQTTGDPNIAYLATLSSEEIDRFLLTLNGPDLEPGQQQTVGCNATASEEAYADWNRFFDALPNFTVLGEERDTHPDWLAARALWKECMIGRGFDYSEPDAIRTDVLSRMREAVAQVYPGGQLPLIETSDGFALDPDVDRLLGQQQDFEIAAAIANVECTEPLADQFDAVNDEVQQAFVDRHGPVIDALLAANAATA